MKIVGSLVVEDGGICFLRVKTRGDIKMLFTRGKKVVAIGEQDDLETLLGDLEAVAFEAELHEETLVDRFEQFDAFLDTCFL